jgi:heme oxygenase (biliverdin-IX-beta and delta-forming)
MSAAPGERARRARELLRAARSGVLSSHSAKFPGFPYGSALPHVTDHEGRPVVLISHLAEHTHNVETDSRVSFLVSPSGPALQASARAALLGHARALEAPTALQRRYLRFFPEHAAYLEMGGFRFWIIEPVQVRLIEGFGSLHWVSGETFLATPGELPALEASVLEHMNRDHRDALVAYCRNVDGMEPHQVEMIGIDCDGFDVRGDDRMLRFGFEQTITTGSQARAALAALARVSRA